ncbi:phosphatidylglycerophosphatase A [Jannaschia sp. M317]|uniref:phosphatidylglycerophosphatase A family protein n=1 Tax=Jannaschia sp. M317 TaxID=2867011 RepID=UPI0021A48141|nr:phosphatidylglycerophosphatase A [Jannaschia sp. M317]UWQ16734.1 phosphatidylglycerophosphatase A [Jannaschia sp. M317]
MNRAAHLVATVLGSGNLKPASGTWGTLAALPLGWVVMQAGPLVFTLATIAALPLGLWATRVVVADSGDHDPSKVVIDELLGVWIALLPIAWGAASAGVTAERLWPGWIAAFLLFRLFDIWKPGPVGWMDRRGDAWGVMLDDAVAGVFAAVGVIALAGLAHL